MKRGSISYAKVLLQKITKLYINIWEKCYEGSRVHITDRYGRPYEDCHRTLAHANGRFLFSHKLHFQFADAFWNVHTLCSNCCLTVTVNRSRRHDVISADRNLMAAANSRFRINALFFRKRKNSRLRWRATKACPARCCCLGLDWWSWRLQTGKL